jgi:hypothetical protein
MRVITELSSHKFRFIKLSLFLKNSSHVLHYPCLPQVLRLLDPLPLLDFFLFLIPKLSILVCLVNFLHVNNNFQICCLFNLPYIVI